MNETNAPDKTACIIVAGGSGSRMGGGAEPKQFRMLAGTPVIGWSLKFFAASGLVDKIVVVVPADWIARTRELLVSLNLDVPVEVTEGGIRRQDSVMAGIKKAADCGYVAIHDGARPFPPANFGEGLRRAREVGGAIFAMPATDSTKLVEDERILHTVPRTGLWSAQTPQIFATARLAEALSACDARGVEVTDDASAFEHMGWPVAIVMGSRLNVKVTYPEDFIVAEAIMKGRTE